MLMPVPTLMRAALIGAFGFATVAQAQITVPTFGTRGSVSDEVVTEFMVSLREALRVDSDIEVRNGDLITPGIAGSLDPDLTILIIAAVEGTRYAVSGEISQSNSTEGAPFMISLIVVDAVQERSSDVLSESFAVSGIAAAAAKLADLIIDFIGAAAGLPAGSAELWVTSLPGEADLLVNGVPVGRTSEIDVLSFQEGRYLVEVRKEGFLPESRMVELRDMETVLLSVQLTPIAGGSILVTSVPKARVFLDGVFQGGSPLAVEATLGEHSVRLERDGFETTVLTVRVRDFFRVTRLQEALRPTTDPLLFWPEDRPYLVFIDGELQPGGYAEGVSPGLIDIDIRRAGEHRSFLRALPSTGVFELDFATGELIPIR